MRVWQPDLERQQASNLLKFSLRRADTRQFATTFDYGGVHRWSVDHSVEFWSSVWDFCEVIGDKGARILVDGDKMPGAQWFPDARLNLAENLLRSRRDDEISIVFSGEGQVQKRSGSAN